MRIDAFAMICQCSTAIFSDAREVQVKNHLHLRRTKQALRLLEKVHCFFLGCPVALPLVPICCVACWQPLFRSPHISLKFNDFTVRVLDTDRSTVDRMTWYLREQWMVYLWVYRLAHGGAVSTVMNGTCLFARLQVETLHISIQRMRKQSDVDRGRMCRIRISYGTAREQKCKYKIVNGWQGLFELDFGTKNTLSNIGNSLDI